MWDIAVDENPDDRVSLEELQVQFNLEVQTSTRAAAETAYALAFRYRNEDVRGSRRFDIAKIWAQRAIDLLDSIPADTINDVISTRSSAGGIPLPELLHSGVVRERLNDVLF
jgi:hypothetical protein